MNDETESKPAGDPASPTGDASLAAGETTTFVFTHVLFKAPGAKFVGQGNDRTPMFAVDLGDTKGLLPIHAMKRQFNIAFDSPDDRMINLAVQSLKYVAEIRPGDNVPNEILTGKASWMIDPRHTEIARRRLELQLLASVGGARGGGDGAESGAQGEAPALADTKAITAHLERPENKAKLREAFRAAARAMGRAEDDTAYVLEKLAAFARELAYIEALREWFLQVGAINKKLQLVGRAYDGDRRLKGEIVQMRSLLMTAIREYRDIFTAVDAESADVIAALTVLEKKVDTVRRSRDQLHHLTLVWRDTVVQWRNCNRDNAARFAGAAQATYRFLANRISSGRSLLAGRAGSPLQAR